ncbi:MAG: sulfatase [Bacteroidota bacterium]
MLILVACSHSGPVEESSKPFNVLFIAIDDLNDWTGFLKGHPQAKTPNLDRLAAESRIFERAYCAVPACNPSRVAIMTGMHATTTGIYHNPNYMWDSEAIRNSAITLPKYFSQHGYYTAAKGKLFHHQDGKWAEPDQWDKFEPPSGNRMGKHPDFSENQLASGMPADAKRQRNFDWGSLKVELEETSDYHIAQFAAEQLSKAHDKPFFVAAGLFRPHLPWYVPEGYLEQFPLEHIILPDVKVDDLNDIPPVGIQISSGLKERSDYQRVKEYGKFKEAVQAYLASIKYADDCLGIILDALDNSPHKDNTIVVLWGDHGWHLAEKLHYRKFTLWEEAVRVPLLIKVPGMTENGQPSKRTVSLLDLYPTLTELCGLPQNEKVEGLSLVPMLKDPRASRERPALTSLQPGRHTVRSEQFRYIRYEDGTEELYDHDTDPMEWHNLAGDRAYEAVKKEHAKWIPQNIHPAIGEDDNSWKTK